MHMRGEAEGFLAVMLRGGVEYFYPQPAPDAVDLLVF